MISFGFLATNLTLDYGTENVTLFLYNTVTKIDFYIKIISNASAQKWDFEKDFSCIICMAIIKYQHIIIYIPQARPRRN